MGDCRIKVDIAKELVSQDQDSSTTRGSTISVTHTCSADTTIREVCEAINALWDLINSDIPIGLWDCTLHPPKDISDWPKLTYPDVDGAEFKNMPQCWVFPIWFMDGLTRWCAT